MEGWGGRGYTLHWQPYWRDTHITRDMCAGIHISRGYTYHWWGQWWGLWLDFGGDGRTDGHVAPKLLQSRPQGLFVFQYEELQPNLTV